MFTVFIAKVGLDSGMSNAYCVSGALGKTKSLERCRIQSSPDILVATFALQPPISSVADKLNSNNDT